MPHRHQTKHPLAVLREQQNLSQQMLADFAAVSLSSIQRMEAGKSVSPYVRRQICTYLSKSPQELGLLSDSLTTLALDDPQAEALPPNVIVFADYCTRRAMQRGGDAG